MTDRLEKASHALSIIMPGYSFVQDRGRPLRIVKPQSKYYPDVVWRLRSDKLWPASCLANHVSGGTDVQAICQLVLWFRDEPRRPLRCWKHWYSPDSKIVEYLATTDYSNKTQCIFCGAAEPGDWWTLRNVFGPCCCYGRCLKGIRATNESD